MGEGGDVAEEGEAGDAMMEVGSSNKVGMAVKEYVNGVTRATECCDAEIRESE